MTVGPVKRSLGAEQSKVAPQPEPASQAREPQDCAAPHVHAAVSARPPSPPAVATPVAPAASAAWRLGPTPASKKRLSPEQAPQLAGVVASKKQALGARALPTQRLSYLEANGQRFYMVQTLARGTFGKFRIAMNDEKRFFAVKEFRGQPKDNKTLPLAWPKILAELDAQSLSPKLPVLHVFHCTSPGKDSTYSFMPLFKSSVADVLSTLTPENRAAFARTVTAHVAADTALLHRKGYIHRDIKPENVLLNTQFAALCDMGLATKYKEGPVLDICGTDKYMAPEVFAMDPRGYGPAADVWSLAMTFVDMHTRSSPFNDVDADALGRSLAIHAEYETWHQDLHVNGKLDMSRVGTLGTDFDPIWLGIRDADAESAEHLLGGAAHPDPAKRPSMQQEADYWRARVQLKRAAPDGQEIDDVTIMRQELYQRQTRGKEGATVRRNIAEDLLSIRDVVGGLPSGAVAQPSSHASSQFGLRDSSLTGVSVGSGALPMDASNLWARLRTG